MSLKKLKLFRPITRRKLFFSILVSFFVLVFMVMLSSSWIFSSMYTRTVYEQLSSEYTYSLERLGNEFDNIFIQANEMNYYLRQNPAISSFLLSIDHDYLTINLANIFLSQTHYINRYLRSIILYNSSFEYPIISGNIDIGINQFVNGTLVKPDIKSRYNIVKSASTPNGLAGVGTIGTLSIVFTDSGATNVVTDQAIIMNIDREEVEKKLLGQYEGTTVVADNSGKVIFNSFNYPVGPDIANQQYFKEILAGGELSGSLNITPGGENNIITYRKSLVSDFYLINIQSLNDITKAIRVKRNQIILISLGIVLFFYVAGYFLSRRIYSPIKKVTEMISGSKYAGAKARMGEIATISEVFTETLEHLKDLEIASEGKNNRIKEELLRSLLKSNSVPDTLEHELSDYKLRIEFDNLVLVSVKIDNYGQLDPNDKYAYTRTLCKSIPDILIHDFNCETVDMFEGEMAVFLNFKNRAENSFGTITASMDGIRDVAKNNLHITLTIGIGGAANSVRECLAAYEKAMDMVKHRFILGVDRTYYQSYLDEHLVSNLVYPVEIEERLVESIKANKKEAFLENLQNAIELLKQYPYPEAVSAFFQIVTACIKTVNQTTSQINNMFYLKFDDIGYIFSSLQTLDQAKAWLTSIFDEYRQMLEEINRLKNSRHYKMIEKMQQQIKQHFNDINMSVESLADIAGYTPYYFSKIFREVTGMNVTDFIRSIRINKAKELLGNESFKINEIPAMVGLNNITHFYSVFKKDVGLTPSAYRECILQNKLSG